nr:hypothetical protein [Candidatus Anoxychlamydiales bacterium]
MFKKEFKINKFLSLELRGSKTFIYVNGKEFTQCRYVLLNIPIDDIEQYNAINSIDEVLDNLDHSLEENSEALPPGTEFWAHCSNLQAWAEREYNVDLLDSKISFPLLKTLSQEGDLIAKKVFKEEIAKRLMRGEMNSIAYLIDLGYLKYFTQEELNTIFSSDNCSLFKNILDAFKGEDTDQFHEAYQIYKDIGVYLFSAIRKKLKQIFDTDNIEDLC